MKKVLINILIFTFLFGGLFGVLGVNSAFAEEGLNAKAVGFVCGFTSPTNCLAVISYHLYGVTSLIVTLSAKIFDSLLAFSLSSKIIDQGFVKQAWDAVRGFVNMIFILILVVISISIILDIKKYGSNQLIKNVIIIALLVNFSLFAARVVIDTGNIVALGFYSAIDSPTNSPAISGVSVAEKRISGGVMKSFNPTRLISADSFKKWREAYKKENNLTGGYAGLVMFITIFGVAIGLNLYISYLFFMAGWIFVVRVAWLWILMILSPLAFISFTIPGLGNQWSRWWTELFNKSFCIVVFMFFIWLTLLIVGDEFYTDAFSINTVDSSFVQLITMVVLQAIIVFVLLGKSLKITKKMCDDGGFGDKMLGMMKTGATVAATGGAGFLARQSIGRGAAATGEWLKNQGVGTGRMGKLALKNLRKVGDVKFGAKEGYTSQQVTGAQEHKAYIDSLPKEYTDSKGVKRNAQEEALENLRNQSPFFKVMNTVTGGRTGASKYVDHQDKVKKYKEDIDKFREDLRLFEREKNDAEVSMRDLKNKKPFNQGAYNTVETKWKDRAGKIDKLKVDIKSTEDKIKKEGEKMKKPKKT